MKPNIILASASAGRADILRSHDLDFHIDAANIDEDAYHADTGEQLVKILAYEKAKVVAPRHVDTLIIAADTLIILDDLENETILGKPTDSSHAKQMLQMLSGRTHRVISGLCVYQLSQDDQVTHYVNSETTYVTFKELSEDTITHYIASGEAMGKSGSYGIQGMAKEFVEKIDGHIDNVIGMPMTLLKKIFPQFNIHITEEKL